MINILLLEDNENIAQTFIRNFSSELVRIKVVSNIPELFHELSYQEFDTIIIDPIMSATLDFPRLLEELGKTKTEIKIAYPDQIISTFQKQADKRNIESVSLKDTEQLFSIIESLLKRKSGGSTQIKEKNTQLEIRVIKTEVHLDNLTTRFNKQESEIDEIKDKITTQSSNLIEMKNNQVYMIDSLKKLKSDVENIADGLEEVAKEDPNTQLLIKDKEEGTKRFIAIIGIITALLTTIGVVSMPFSQVIVEYFKHSPQKNHK